MDYMTRVRNFKEEYKAENGHYDVIPLAWMINFFVEWEKVTAQVKKGARERGIDLNYIELASR